ncbi:4'-phosphopantetheinyl transferase family protein [Paludisphaera rhizosphaerae]|uniref:4'-phosphopantetheinyl transferase family protein n=1 Tax=Paludisphaera rhizosphaerae TaxID=2711216 RepID=UPI0013EBCF88|nr:4'-phosphopantetheinyl transferase superfamily protein [Paludisphaera rhizosphaerae]
MSTTPPLILDFAGSTILPATGTIHVYRVDLSGDDAFRQSAEWDLLSADERARAERLVRARDGRKFVKCRGALRSILGGLSHVAPDSVAFEVGPGGKPMLPDGPWRFNVSHSGELALIAVAQNVELGVDVEEYRTIQQSDRIVESYFTAAESAEFRRLDEDDRSEAFIRGWTRKEAVVKAQGVGLAGLATEFETLFGAGRPPEAFRLCEPMDEVRGWRLWEVSPRPGYVATLAVAID